MNSSPHFKKVFAVVVTYNGARWIRKCLLSLKQSSYPVSVIVIDNGSKDETTRIIENNFPEVLLVRENLNLGFGQANNKGISIALKQGADYVFLLNQDAWMEENTMGDLVATEFESKGYGILSPLHVNNTGDNLDKGFRNCISKNISGEVLLAIDNGLTTNEIFEVDFINAAAWLMSKSALEKAGGFNPLLFHYGEDAEYCLRLYYHRLKVGFISGGRIHHDRADREQSPFFINYQKLTWYYTVGVKARLLNVAHPFVLCLTKMLFWSMKECGHHFISGRWFAVFSWFGVWRKNLSELASIIRNRKLLKSTAKFLFLSVS